MSIILILTLFQVVDLEALQKALEELGNPWTAGTTSVSGLSDEEKREMCGAMTPQLFEEEKSIILNMPPAESRRDVRVQMPPLAWDWRDHAGHNWMTPVKTQLACGNCYLFATLGGFEARLKIINNLPDTNIDLSEEFVTSCDTRNYGCHGGILSRTARFIVERGIPDEMCFPYEGKVLPCINACPDWELRAKKAETWDATSRVEEYKSRIMEGPMACYLTPKGDFFYYKGGVYTPILGEKYVHATTLCGWNDTLGAWLFKNSWDIGWGDGGYGWINYGEEQIVGPGYPVWLEIEGGKLQLDVVNRAYASDETNNNGRDREDEYDSDDRASQRRTDCARFPALAISPDPSRFDVFVNFRLSRLQNVSIVLYDVTGKPVSCVIDNIFRSGDHRIVWNRTDEANKVLKPGIYFFRLKSSSGDCVKKAILL